MATQTEELGPIIGHAAPNFVLQDHDLNPSDLDSIMGENGVLIGFIRDIWQPASIRRVLFMQKHHRKFLEQGINIALIIADQPNTLYSFHLSTEVKMSVTLLADPDSVAHRAYNMFHSGLVLIDDTYTIRNKWLVPDERVWLRPKELLDELYAPA
ncbi:MAG: redoxin domain-containing protein [Chloroflexota bacterium]